jgi:hypothetical protein
MLQFLIVAAKLSAREAKRSSFTIFHHIDKMDFSTGGARSAMIPGQL